MGEPVLWVGGWASSLACWREELTARYPDREHRFLDAHEILSRPAALPEAAAALPPGGIVAAWSLGSLLLHRRLAEGDFPARPVLSLSPVFAFTGPRSPWPPAALARMIRRLGRDRDTVLREFWTQVKGTSPVTPVAEAAWLRQADGYALVDLVAGLEALLNLAVDPAHPSLAAAGLRLMAGERDPLAPAGPEVSGAPKRVLYPEGHLPFLDHPDLVEPLLGPTDREGRI